MHWPRSVEKSQIKAFSTLDESLSIQLRLFAAPGKRVDRSDGNGTWTGPNEKEECLSSPSLGS
jgi:hypothetical protein